MKTLNQKVMLILSIFSLLISSAASNPPLKLLANAQNNLKQGIEVTISDNPLTDDETWPIIKNETNRRKDPSTGTDVIETIVVREKPQTKEQKDCQKNNQTKSVTLASTCIIQTYSILKTINVPGPGGGVTAYVKSWADRYCEGVVCDFYKLTKIDAWWTRISTSWGVRSANILWGCDGSCVLCGTNGSNTTNFKFNSGFFNPTWNGLTSAHTIYSSSTFPIMETVEGVGYVSAKSTSIVVLPNNQTQSLTALITW